MKDEKNYRLDKERWCLFCNSIFKRLRGIWKYMSNNIDTSIVSSISIHE
jgi:hypothetical protein